MTDYDGAACFAAREAPDVVPRRLEESAGERLAFVEWFTTGSFSEDFRQAIAREDSLTLLQRWFDEALARDTWDDFVTTLR